MNFLRHPLGGLAMAAVVAGQALPYNPSRILVSPTSDIAYLLQPSPRYPGSSRFVSLDLTRPISDTQSDFSGTFGAPPFLQGDDPVPYTTFIDPDGNITAITGDCSRGAQGIEVYHFMPAEDDGTGNGKWVQYTVSTEDLKGQEAEAGANYLAGGMAFSTYTEGNISDTSLYLFGGMCSYENSTADTWTSNATYSNTMLALNAQVSESGNSDYEISLASGRGPPIAEAGFTITGLPPTYSDDNVESAQTQQQDFVLLGGHTQVAFINMSQVALFSLPQESWTFLPVTQPSGAKSDLAARQSVAPVEPRSGHTAVLSEDGGSIVLFGGWVGDVNTPAQPQLAVLKLGAGYGGTGDWTWTVPDQNSNGLPEGSGIYGHGAALLPGGVMMVAGGYSIPATSTEARKRDEQQPDSSFMFYNTTSNTWIETYNPPSKTSGLAHGEKNSSGALTKTSQKAGLGVGLAIGVILLVALILIYFYYNRKMRRQREERARVLLAHSSDGSFGQPFLEKGSIDGHRGNINEADEYWQLTGRSAGANWDSDQHQMQQSGNATGMFMNMPSPTRGLRKGVGNKAYQYHAAPRYDDKRANRGSGVIHPIAEHEEEDNIEREPAIGDHLTLSEAQQQLRDLERVLASNPKNVRDPFRDPEPNPLGSHPVSPEMNETVRRVPTVISRATSPPRRPVPWDQDSMPNWTTEIPADEPLLYDQSGRGSPTKTDERTSSNLSEHSQRSTNSSNSMTRTMSTRTGALLAAAIAARRQSRSPDGYSPIEERPPNSGRKSPYTRQRSSTAGSSTANPPPSASTDSDSFRTARSSFLALQHEGENLLGGRPAADRDDPYQRALAAHSPTPPRPSSNPYDSLAGVPSLPNRKRQGFMGSLRRAIGVMGERSFSLTGSHSAFPPDATSPTTPSPIRPARPPLGQAPRRAVSDGGFLLRQKRGRKDWEPSPFPPYRDNPDPGDWGEPRSSLEQAQAEEDWDVEGAIGQRDVQVMFSVPKTRLRVVNDDMDRASLRSASDGQVSRSGSTRSGGERGGSFRTVRKEESVKGLRGRAEGGGGALAATVEEEDGFEWKGKAKDL